MQTKNNYAAYVNNFIGLWLQIITMCCCGLEFVKEQKLITQLNFHIFAMFGVIVSGDTHGYTKMTDN